MEPPHGWPTALTIALATSHSQTQPSSLRPFADDENVRTGGTGPADPLFARADQKNGWPLLATTACFAAQFEAAMDIEAEYNNRARVADHAAIMEGWKSDAAAYRRTARCAMDLDYGGAAASDRTRLDLFMPADSEPKAVAMFIHGGYWQALDKSMFSHLARGLNAQGFAVAVPSYDLCPSVTIATITEQMRAACLWLADRFFRPILVAGHSAGGHLAACMLATNWSRPRPRLGFDPVLAAYPISGIFELQPLVRTSVNSALRLDLTSAEAASPALWPAPSGKHLIAAVGSAESDEYHRQSRLICGTWAGGGTTTRLSMIEGANHFTILAPLADPRSPMIGTIVDLARVSALI